MNKNENKIHVFFTAYGPFMNIKENPTSLIAKQIESERHLIEEKLKNRVKIHQIKILKVEKDPIDLEMKQIYREIEELNNNGVPVLLIHTGVYSGSQSILLETLSKKYFNDYVGTQCHINEFDQIECKINLRDIHSNLKGSHKVGLSCDAGDYYCNYVYHCSNTAVRDLNNTHCVFIHFPDIDVVDTNQGVEFLVNFINECVRA